DAEGGGGARRCRPDRRRHLARERTVHLPRPGWHLAARADRGRCDAGGLPARPCARAGFLRRAPRPARRSRRGPQRGARGAGGAGPALAGRLPAGHAERGRPARARRLATAPAHARRAGQGALPALRRRGAEPAALGRLPGLPRLRRARRPAPARGVVRRNAARHGADRRSAGALRPLRLDRHLGQRPPRRRLRRGSAGPPRPHGRVEPGTFGGQRDVRRGAARAGDAAGAGVRGRAAARRRRL
ncbi:MAG: NAD-dependent protein deacetylase of SIR2 family, partial [uncultured Acetobacteraceae bacterium]